jgi:hypothetical protein
MQFEGIQKLVNTDDIWHEMVAKPFQEFPVSCCYAGCYRRGMGRNPLNPPVLPFLWLTCRLASLCFSHWVFSAESHCNIACFSIHLTCRRILCKKMYKQEQANFNHILVLLNLRLTCELKFPYFRSLQRSISSLETRETVWQPFHARHH